MFTVFSGVLSGTDALVVFTGGAQALAAINT